MQLVLIVTSGEQLGRKLHLRGGQQASVGKSELTDFSFPDDPEMADHHFRLDCNPKGCTIGCYDDAQNILVNGSAVTMSAIYHDDLVMAGTTQFRVVAHGPFAMRPPESNSDGPGEDSTVKSNGQESNRLHTLGEICLLLKLEQEVEEIAAKHETFTPFIQELIDEGQFQAAVRIEAHRLPKPESVWWGCYCLRRIVQPQLSPEELAALNAAEAWALDPIPERSRDAETAATACKSRGPGVFLAYAAFWSGESIGPAESEAVPPDDKLTGQAVFAALVLAAYAGEKPDAAGRFRGFLRVGEKLAAGELKIAPLASEGQ